MQVIDPADPRRPNVKIAASIRAAILSGELEPGQRLPSIEELAEFFGVAKVTIGAAIRTLRDEGYVTSRPGAGIWVSGQASSPSLLASLTRWPEPCAFLFEMGYLKTPAPRRAGCGSASQAAGERGRALIPSQHHRHDAGRARGRRPRSRTRRCASCTTRTKPGSATFPRPGAPTSPPLSPRPSRPTRPRACPTT